MIGNEKGSIEALQLLRDVGEDCGNHLIEMEAYLNLGILLNQNKKYEEGIFCFKRLL